MSDHDLTANADVTLSGLRLCTIDSLLTCSSLKPGALHSHPPLPHQAWAMGGHLCCVSQQPSQLPGTCATAGMVRVVWTAKAHSQRPNSQHPHSQDMPGCNNREVKAKVKLSWLSNQDSCSTAVRQPQTHMLKHKCSNGNHKRWGHYDTVIQDGKGNSVSSNTAVRACARSQASHCSTAAPRLGSNCWQ